MHIDSIPPSYEGTPVRQRYTYLCETCGSDNVKLDAWAVWSVETQDWVLDNTFDQAFCVACDGNCEVVKFDIKEGRVIH